MEVNGEGPDGLAGMVISGLLCVWGGGGVWAIPDPRWLKVGLTVIFPLLRLMCQRALVEGKSAFKETADSTLHFLSGIEV